MRACSSVIMLAQEVHVLHVICVLVSAVFCHGVQGELFTSFVSSGLSSILPP
jgi:hypothetical protein